MTTTDSRPATTSMMPRPRSSDATNSDHATHLAEPEGRPRGRTSPRPAAFVAIPRSDSLGGPDTSAASGGLTPKRTAPQGPNSPGPDLVAAPQAHPARGTQAASRQRGSAAHIPGAAGAGTGPAAMEGT